MTPTTEARERVVAVRALLDAVRRGKAEMGDVLTGSIAMLDMAAEWLREDDGLGVLVPETVAGRVVSLGQKSAPATCDRPGAWPTTEEST